MEDPLQSSGIFPSSRILSLSLCSVGCGVVLDYILQQKDSTLQSWEHHDSKISELRLVEANVSLAAHPGACGKHTLRDGAPEL